MSPIPDFCIVTDWPVSLWDAGYNLVDLYMELFKASALGMNQWNNVD